MIAPTLLPAGHGTKALAGDRAASGDPGGVDDAEGPRTERAAVGVNSAGVTAADSLGAQDGPRQRSIAVAVRLAVARVEYVVATRVVPSPTCPAHARLGRLIAAVLAFRAAVAPAAAAVVPAAGRRLIAPEERDPPGKGTAGQELERRSARATAGDGARQAVKTISVRGAPPA
jgi:hypothetical protein